MNKAAEVLGILVTAFAGMLGLVLLRGLVLADLWRRFLTPFGLPSIGIAHAIGVSTIFGMLAMGLAIEKDDKDDDLGPWAKVAKPLFKGLIYCLFGWGMGAIAHGFM